MSAFDSDDPMRRYMTHLQNENDSLRESLKYAESEAALAKEEKERALKNIAANNIQLRFHSDPWTATHYLECRVAITDEFAASHPEIKEFVIHELIRKFRDHYNKPVVHPNCRCEPIETDYGYYWPNNE